ncbi:BamA/TamA family outer membrane protein [Nostoc sp. XA010]|uniref:ShlB/FhaC/HecB family hemolysin secretion/activation protein n=1 Tax=Nostoc sp. XA010 TaxID=2780407 RepID=UPI001E2F5F3C|nr:ShlB/FhaC/HecB family hemolysin secretion/activation protein [Nostoc sp. XA010]MCC5659045.1 BamA/TamA family outer membrane protein [Nostoc sp. XA010]
MTQVPPTPLENSEPNTNSDETPLEENPSPSIDNNQPVTPSTKPESAETPESAQPFPVNTIKVTGSKVFSPKELAAINLSFPGCSVNLAESTGEAKDDVIFRLSRDNSVSQLTEGCSVTLAELTEVSDKITQLYLNKGYITSRAVVLEKQTVTNPNREVEIKVYEGTIVEIKVEGTQRVNPEYIRSRIRLAGLNPLRKDKLEEQLILLRSDPLFKNVEASLRSPGAGSKFGESIVIVRVTEAQPFKVVVGIDNYSPPSIGSEKLGVGLAYRSLIVSGDQISAAYNRSTTGGLNFYDFNYRLPVNPMNGTVQVRAAINNSKITERQFSQLNIRGDSELYEISYRQPLVRSLREEFALSFGFSYQDGQTFLFDNRPFRFGIGPDQNGVSRTSVFKFGQDYVKRDLQGAWTLQSQFSLGTGLFDGTINDHPIPDSRFFSWSGQIQRIQQLSQNQQLIASLDLQLTPNSLLPSQQFIIGGGQSVRGYRQNARSGDNGFRFSVEDQISVVRNEAGLATLLLAPFIDVGAVWNNSDNPNNPSLPSQRFLSSAGLGLLWQPLPKLNVRLDYGIPFIDLRDRGNNAQDSGFYFSVYYQP